MFVPNVSKVLDYSKRYIMTREVLKEENKKFWGFAYYPISIRSPSSEIRGVPILPIIVSGRRMMA